MSKTIFSLRFWRVLRRIANSLDRDYENSTETRCIPNHSNNFEDRAKRHLNKAARRYKRNF